MKLYNKIGIVSVILGTLVLSACGGSDYTVGVTTMVFSDNEIAQKVSADMQALLKVEENGSRDLMVKIWYPSEPLPDEESRRHYGYHTENNDFAIDPETGSEILNFLRANKQQSQSYQHAQPLGNSAFPVIFYSHGYGGLIEENEPYYEALVKKGYIVVSIGHTGEASLVTLKNAETITFSEDFSEDAFGRELPIEAQDPTLAFTQQDALALSDIPLGEQLPSDLLQRYHYSTAQIGIGNQEHLNLWVLDTHFVLSQLEKINQGHIVSPLKGLFDLSRIGAVGHSYGGATARRFCNEEPRCFASINMDGSSFALFNEQILAPHLQYSSDINAVIAEEIRDGEEINDIEETRQRLSIEKQNDNHATINATQTDNGITDLYLVTLQSIAHLDFTGSWVDIHDFGLGKQVWHPIIESTSVDFFDTYLKSGISQLFLCDMLNHNKNITVDFINNCNQQ